MKTFLITILLSCTIGLMAQEAEYRFIPCDKEKAKHRNDGEAAEVIMINDLETSVKVFWMNARGQQTEYADLFPDEEFPVNTYTNHYWVFEDEQGCLGIIQMKTSGEVKLSGFPKFKRRAKEDTGGH